MPTKFLLDRLLRRERLDRSMEEELRFHITERALTCSAREFR